MRAVFSLMLASMAILGFASEIQADEPEDRAAQEARDRKVINEGEVIASDLEFKPGDIYGLWRLVIRYDGEVYVCSIVEGKGGAFACRFVHWKP